MMIKSFIAAAGLATIFVTPGAASGSCLQLDRIYSWDVLDNKTLIVVDDIHEKFRLTLMGYCPNLSFKERLGFKIVGGMGIDCVSKGDDVLLRDIGMGYRCPIVNIVPYTLEMEKAEKAAAAAKAAQQNGNP